MTREHITMVTLTQEAAAVIAGMVASTDDVQADHIFTEKWEEIRAAFPLDSFREWAESHPDFYSPE